MVSTAILERRDTITKTPWPERIAAKKERLITVGDEAQHLRYLPAWGSNEMAAMGIYRFVLPEELGGENLRAEDQIAIIEAMSAIDGSVGWCTQISSEINALVIRRMEPAFAHQIYDDWNALVCSGLGSPNGPNPGQTARQDGTGWRLNYQGSFASGCHNATWNFVMSGPCVDEATGEPAAASFMVPRGEFEIMDTWDMAGMRGSGSNDVRMTDRYVPPEHTLPAAALGPSEIWDNPTYRNPNQVPYNKSAVALGVCKGAIDELIDLAMVKTPWGSGTPLKDMPQFHYRLAECRATYLAARAFLIESQRAVEAHLGPLPAKGGKLVPDWEVYWPGFLSCIYSAQAVRHVVDVINNTAGTTGNRMDSPLERKLRDAHQAAAHGGISWRHFETMGKSFAGGGPPPNYARLTGA